jgi:hypothetical protein
MRVIHLQPQGDVPLIGWAKEIQVGYGCSHSADGLYIAPAEELRRTGSAEFVTFDEGAVNQILKHAPTVSVNLLPT